MNNLIIEQNLSSAETVNNIVIEKLYKLALTSNVENQSSPFNMSLKGSIYATAAYEDSVIYLRNKFPQLTINVQDNNFYIRFADDEVSRVLINNISSDGVGVSRTDAQRLTVLPLGIFRNNTTIQTFNELSQFGSIEIDGRCFQGATNLTNIDLSTVTRVKGASSFEKCSNLNIKLNMPNLISLGQFSFRQSGITEIEDLGHVTEIPGYSSACFQKCTNLTKVTLPQSCLRLGINCFAEDINLTTISPTQYLNALESGCLFTKGNISSIMNFANVTSLGTMCEGQGWAVGEYRTTFKQIYLPKVTTPSNTTGWANTNNTYYRKGIFMNIGADLLYLRDIQHFYGASFSNCQITALVINNVVPPTIHYHLDYTQQEYEDWKVSNPDYVGTPTDLFALASITTIYVPDSAVNTYKNDPIWSTWASKIDSMNNLTKVPTEADLQQGQIALIEAYM